MTSRKKVANKKISSRIFFYSAVLFIVLLIVFIGRIFFGRSVWLSESKLTLLQFTKEKNLEILILDSYYGELSKIVIPKDLEVEVAGNLGRRRVGNLWELGVDEKKEGLLVQRTIEKNFYFPLTAWVGPDVNLSKAGLYEKILFVFGKGKTSLTVGDRLRVVTFILRTASKVTVLDMSETAYLRAGVLSDGGGGYVLTGEVSDKILSYFADKTILDSSYKIMIKRDSGSTMESEIVGKLLENLGIKPAYSSSDTLNPGCNVFTIDEYLAVKLSGILPCKIIKEKNGIFDATIYVGPLDREF